MAKVMSVIRSTGTFTDKDTKRDVAFDNYIFYMTSGERMYNHEQLIVGEGKPAQVKIKVKELEEVYKDDPKLLFGKEVRFLTENGILAKVEIGQK